LNFFLPSAASPPSDASSVFFFAIPPLGSTDAGLAGARVRYLLTLRRHG
jgi:hypothetical protein